MKDKGYHPIDVRYGDGYLIQYDKDSVVTFHIKECKGWLFGLWWEKDHKTFDFFAQYEKEIDKFKPCASTFTQSGYLSGVGSNMETTVNWDILPIIKFIKKHRYLAWNYDQHSCVYVWDYVGRFKAWRNYIKHWWKYYVRLPRIKKKMVQRYLILMDKFGKSCLCNYRIIDGNKGGFSCSPRFEIICDSILGEDLAPGFYEIDYRKELALDFSKSADKYISKLERLDKKYRGCFYDIDINPTKIGVIIRKTKKCRSKKIDPKNIIDHEVVDGQCGKETEKNHRK